MSESPAEGLARAVAEVGADIVFGMPGGGPNLEMIGALERAGLRFVLTHDETAACTAAATYGLLVGRTAVALATRGPGVANGANGVLQATLDRFPLLFVTDCVAERDHHRVGHQRVDQRAMMRPLTKGSGRLGGADDKSYATAMWALMEANFARRGAVHLDYDAAAPCEQAVEVSPAPEATYELVAAARQLLAGAQRPVAIVGLGALDDHAAVRAELERLACPVLTTYQAAGVLPDGHPQLAGLYTNGVIESGVLAHADVVLAVGLDPTEPMPGRFRYDVPVVAVDAVAPDAAFLPTTVQLIGTPAAMLRDIVGGACTGWGSEAGADALADARHRLRAAAARPDAFGPVELVDALVAAAPAGASVTVDAGAHFLAVMPFWPVRSPLQLLISNGAATMGFAMPAAVGAALARPGTPVVCCVGDGGLGMMLAELETIARLQLPVTVVVFDDAALSLIEVKQREGQGGLGAVRFAPVDYAAVGAAMGLTTAVATNAAEVDAFLRDGWHLPRLLDARIDASPYRDLVRVTRG